MTSIFCVSSAAAEDVEMFFSARCQLATNHEGKNHTNRSKQCKYQHQFENKVYLCKVKLFRKFYPKIEEFDLKNENVRTLLEMPTFW